MLNTLVSSLNQEYLNRNISNIKIYIYREEDSQRVSNKHVHVFMKIFVPNYIDPGAFKIYHIS